MTTEIEGKPRRRPARAALPKSADPLAMAMASAVGDPTAEAVVRTMLAKQEQLIEAQIAQLDRQQWREVALAALVAVIVVASAWFVWSASRAEGIVVSPFAVPPALAQRGVTGAVVASQILDRLNAMQAETSSIRPASSYGDDWSGNIKVELPYGGVSIGELRRYLVSWLGDQRTLSGEVVALPGGALEVTARISGVPGLSYKGPALDALIQQAAEGVYRETQAYRYAGWLRTQGRADEARPIALYLSRSTDPVERMWGLHSLGIDTEDPHQSIAIYRRVAAIDPTFPATASNTAGAQFALGHLEAACRNTTRSVDLYDQWRDRLRAGSVEVYILLDRSRMATCQGDLAGAAALQQQAIEHPADFRNTMTAPLTLAAAQSYVHDVAAARATLREAGLDDPVRVAGVLEQVGPGFDPQLAISLANGDWVEVRARLSAVLAGRGTDERQPPDLWSDIFVQSTLAEAYARTGSPAEAAAVIAATPLDCDPCLRARGLVAALARRPAEADRWLTRLARRTPSLPYAHEAMAEVKLLRGDRAGAIRAAERAHALGPRWAEPLKLWGDALLSQGKRAEARAKYEQALERAPKWLALRRARDAVAGRS